MTDLTPSHLSDEQFIALCPQGEHAPGPEPLSPAAQAVLDAMRKELDYAPIRHLQWAGAAALRAAANQDPDGLNTGEYDEGWGEAMATVIAIATELEGRP